jgi:hypothetical protein
LSSLFYFLIASKNGTGKIGDIGVLEIIAERVYLYQTGGWFVWPWKPLLTARIQIEICSIPSRLSPRIIILTAMAASNRLNTLETALSPPFPRKLIILLPSRKIPHAMSIFRMKESETRYSGNRLASNNKVVIVAGPAVRGVPIGTTATISSLTASTILPVVMYLMENTSRIIPPAMAKEPTEIPSTFKIS